jgi:hypothetical protein
LLSLHLFVIFEQAMMQDQPISSPEVSSTSQDPPAGRYLRMDAPLPGYAILNQLYHSTHARDHLPGSDVPGGEPLNWMIFEYDTPGLAQAVSFNSKNSFQ